MALLISTNMYRAEDIKRVLPYLDLFEDQVGVEVFPMFHQEEYGKALDQCLPRLSRVPISFHGPYYGAEHTAAPGTPEYDRTMAMVGQTLEYGRGLSSRYMVFHHNNRPVKDADKEGMMEVSCANYRRVRDMSADWGIPVVVENAGVRDRGNMMLDEEEFVSLCRKEEYPVLIDIGHAHANGWDLYRVTEALKDQIRAFHIHNNDGVHDSHLRIGKGTLDVERFLTYSRHAAPGADWVLEYSLEEADDTEGIAEDVDRLLKRYA